MCNQDDWYAHVEAVEAAQHKQIESEVESEE